MAFSSDPGYRLPATGYQLIPVWIDGWKRVASSPSIVAGVFVLTLLLALPLALTLRGLLEAHLANSVVANDVVNGVSYDWWQEFLAQTTSLGTTFVPTIIGFAATLDNVSSVLDGQPEIVPVASLLAVYLALWTFLAGGILDRYARQRPTRAHGFFAASGMFFFRFLRLAVLALVFYWWLFAYVHPWMFDEVYRDLTRDLNVERTAFVWRLSLYAVFGALLVLVNIVFDYAKIRAVVEDRRSMLGALIASIRVVARHPGRVLPLYALNSVVFLVVIGLWALVAPHGGEAGPWMVMAFVLGQLYLLARLTLKLHFLASQVALFQASLAHAAYTAAPIAVWPESPAAETIATI